MTPDEYKKAVLKRLIDDALCKAWYDVKDTYDDIKPVEFATAVMEENWRLLLGTLDREDES